MLINRHAAERTQADDVLHVWIASAVRHLRVVPACEPYEYAIVGFKDDQVIAWCLSYASLESRFLEFDRMRAIFIHATQFADPARWHAFWQAYQEMLVQRNLASARFNTTAHQGLANTGLAESDEDNELAEADAMTLVME
jgi:hypothetical protein